MVEGEDLKSPRPRVVTKLLHVARLADQLPQSSPKLATLLKRTEKMEANSSALISPRACTRASFTVQPMLPGKSLLQDGNNSDQVFAAFDSLVSLRAKLQHLGLHHAEKVSRRIAPCFGWFYGVGG